MSKIDQLMSLAAYQQTPINRSGVSFNSLPNHESLNSPDKYRKLSRVAPISNGVRIDYIN
jgi:hypothetical protein